MYDPEEQAELLKKHEALMAMLRLPEARAQMIKEGLDPEAELKDYADSVETMRAEGAKTEKILEHYLQTTANVADAEYALFKTLRHAIQIMRDAEIYEPQLDEMEDFLREWAKRLPKEPDDPSAPPR